MPIWLRSVTSHSSTPPSSVAPAMIAGLPMRARQEAGGEAPDAHVQHRPIGQFQQPRPGPAVQRQMAVHQAPDAAEHRADDSIASCRTACLRSRAMSRNTSSISCRP